MTIDGTGFDDQAPRAAGHESVAEFEGEIPSVEFSPPADGLTLEELVAQLEQDPDECQWACQALESIDAQTRTRIIRGLSEISTGDGVKRLLQLLAASENLETREAAIAAENLVNPGSRPGVEILAHPLDVRRVGSQEIVRVEDRLRPRIMNCLVTAVDGSGMGAVVISALRQSERCTAMFLAEVERGVTAVIGQAEPESPHAGSLLQEAKAEAGSMGLENVPELALRLLAGLLSLNDSVTDVRITEWLERTVGPGFEPRPFPASVVESGLDPPGGEELLRQADEVLRACPTWLDRSELTFELAEEVLLREGQVEVDPHRDSGAFRFLFEHRILHRLEIYRRMLLWMHWFWTCAGENELARSAQILAWQLGDQQFAVPSHPFTVVLTARSLNAARERLGTDDDPRLSSRIN